MQTFIFLSFSFYEIIYCKNFSLKLKIGFSCAPQALVCLDNKRVKICKPTYYLNPSTGYCTHCPTNSFCTNPDIIDSCFDGWYKSQDGKSCIRCSEVDENALYCIGPITLSNIENIS